MLDALFPYQEEGVAFLAARRRAMLADEQGLGKTAQAILACKAVRASRIAVISPASVRENWRREFKKWWPDASVGLYSYSYEGAVKAINEGTWPANLEVVIIDEAHYLKSPDAKRTKAIYAVIENAPHVWALTGTPCPNNPSELYTAFKYLAPTRILTWKDEGPVVWTEQQFMHRFCKVIDTGFGPKIVGAKDMPALKEKLDGFMLRRKKADVLKDLPPIRFATITLKCEPGDWAEARQTPEGWHVSADELPASDEHIARARRIIAAAKAEVLAKLLRDELEADPTYKVVVYGWHVGALNALASALCDYGVVSITGDTSGRVRQENIDAFQTSPDCRVFIGQIQAAGTGITLTASSNLVFLELAWTPGANAQAAMRVHRIGQHDAVLVRFCQLAGTIDEDVVRVLGRKTKMLAELFD